MNYVCPVKGAKEAILAIDPDIANNPLIFPPADVLARLQHVQGPRRGDEKKYLDAGTRSSACSGSDVGTTQERADGRVGVPARQLGARTSCWPRACSGWRLLRLPGVPDVPASLWTGTLETGFTFTFLELGELHRGLTRYSGAVHPLARLRRAATLLCLPDRLPARLRHRVPRRRATRTCCCSWSSRRSSRASCCAPCPGRSSSPTTGWSSGRSRTSASCPRTSGCCHPGRGHRRDHLQLPAVHDAAAVRRAREDRPAAARGGRGPLRRPVAAGRDDRRGSSVGRSALVGVRDLDLRARSIPAGVVFGGARRRVDRDALRLPVVPARDPAAVAARASSPARC